MASGVIEVFVESGGRRVFASALDWPGWARSAKTEELALAALADYLPRYADIVRLAGLTAPAGPLVVAEGHVGLAKNADFGALGEIAQAEDRPLSATEGARLAALLQRHGPRSIRPPRPPRPSYVRARAVAAGP
jgi:hypothetical protein